jgi:hypothetical protein
MQSGDEGTGWQAGPPSAPSEFARQQRVGICSAFRPHGEWVRVERVMRRKTPGAPPSSLLPSTLFLITTHNHAHHSQHPRLHCIPHKQSFTHSWTLSQLLPPLQTPVPPPQNKVGCDSLSYLITWQGSQPDLRPVLFISHLDVVPVAEASEKVGGQGQGTARWTVHRQARVAGART